MTQVGADHWQAVIDAYQAVRRLPGLTAGVYDDGELVWSGTAGAADAEWQYRIGSISKTFTAALVMRCRDEGLLDLDDALGRFIPESDHREVSVRDLLTHTAGLSSEPVGPWWERSPGVDIDILLVNNQGARTPFAVGEAFHYSNYGFALLGEIVARVRGASWYDVLREQVLDPLGMARTTLQSVAPRAQGYSVDHFRGTLTSEPHQDTGAMAPAGQLWSTLADLGQLVSLLSGDHPDVIKERSRVEMLTVVREGYGLGTMTFADAGRQLVGHLGSMPGFQASALVDVGLRRGVVALTNATTGFSGDEIAWRLLGEHTPARGETWVPSDTVPGWVRELVGLWFWGNSAFDVRWHNDRLEFHDVARGRLAEQFVASAEGIVGYLGYHRGEILQVRRTPDGAVSHLECATFVYTRTPYDPDVNIPGGHPQD